MIDQEITPVPQDLSRRILAHSLVSLGIPACYALFLLAVTTVRAADVKVENRRLLVDGRPFFFLSASGVAGSLQEMKRHHINTVFTSSAQGLSESVKEAESLGLFLMPFIQAPGVKSERIKEMVQTFQSSDHLLAWNIGDDLGGGHYEAVKNAVELVRKLDRRRLPIAFDAIQDEAKTAPLADLFCTYFYPLLKSEWSPRRYREFLQAHTRRAGEQVPLRPDQAFWTWIQVHTQLWYTESLYGGPKNRHIASSFPNPEHIRLLTYEALSAGCKGIIFYSHQFFQPEWHGRDRYAEVGVLGCELEALGPLLADSVSAGKVPCSESEVHAEQMKGPFGSLLILTIEREGYQFHVDEAVIRNITLTLPDSISSKSALLLKFPEPQVLSVKDGKLIIPEIELTAVVLFAHDRSIERRVAKQWSAMLSEAGGFSVEAALGLLEKSRPAFESLRAMAELPPDAQSLWKDANETANEARKALAAKDYAAAWLRSRDSLRKLRMLQHAAWRRAIGDELPNWRRRQDHPRLCFYVIDRHFKWERWLKTAKPGPNLVENPSFEELKQGIAIGWPRPAMARERKAERIFDSTDGHTGSHCLKFVSGRPVLWKGQEEDWVTIDALSTPIAVEAGELYRLSAWVCIAKDFQNTKRGATLGLVGYDEKGETVWAGGSVEVTRPQATDGWQKMEMVVEVQKKIHSLRVRLGACGVGEAGLDDVALRKLEGD